MTGGPARPLRVLVLGGDAAGMSAANQALRTARARGVDLAVTVLQADPTYTSYSACGIPFWVSGQTDGPDSLVARTPEQHRAAGIDLRLGARATAVDPDLRRVTYRDQQGRHTIDFDELVIATGATPIRPDWADLDPEGPGAEQIGTAHDLYDGAAWSRRFDGPPQRVLVVGGGYVGVEMAEAALARGHRVTLVTRGRVMSSLDPEVSDRVAAVLRSAGVTVLTDSPVNGLRRGPGGEVVGLTVAGGQPDERLSGDLVVLGLGVRPSLDFLGGHYPRGDSRALLPDGTGRLAGHVWGAGDCCEVIDRMSGRPNYLPLGTHANKLGRVVGDRVAGGQLSFPGALGTVITRFAHGASYAEIASSGLTATRAAALGLDAISVTTEGTAASGYLPEAEPIAITVVAERGSRRLLGAQIVGGHGAGKRIDTVAACLWADLSVDDLAWMDLAYVPPLATAWEILSIAARRTAEALER